VSIQSGPLADIRAVLAQAPKLPAALQRIATTPILPSETPAGFTHLKITRLGPNKRAHTLGIVRIDFSNSHTSESAGYALLRTHAAAIQFAHQAEAVRTGRLFYTRAVAIRRFTVAVSATTPARAKALLTLALAHLRRSES
jgi:hypothetical protein